MEIDLTINIILLTSSYPSSSDLVNQSFMTDLVESLSKRKIRFFVICPHQLSLPYREEKNNITIIRFPYWFTSSGQKLGGAGGIVPSMSRSLLAIIQIIPFCICQFITTMRTIKKENIDLIHSHWIIPQGIVGIAVRMITGIPHVISIHGTDIHLIHSYRIFYPLMNIITHYSEYISTNSSHTYRLLIDTISKKNVKSCIIPMGIYPEKFLRKCSTISDKEKNILFVGRLIAWKGVYNLIRAMKLVITTVDNVHLTIIGNGPERAQLIQFTKDLGISSQIQFCDNIGKRQLLMRYKNADLFVLPSIIVNKQTEGLGVVLLEAMASGVPVIGSNIGGIPDIIKDEINGLLVPAGDPQALADAIIRILKNPDLAERFRKAGLETVRERFSWDVITDQFVEVYQEILKESHHE